MFKRITEENNQPTLQQTDTIRMTTGGVQTRMTNDVLTVVKRLTCAKITKFLAKRQNKRTLRNYIVLNCNDLLARVQIRLGVKLPARNKEKSQTLRHK